MRFICVAAVVWIIAGPGCTKKDATTSETDNATIQLPPNMSISTRLPVTAPQGWTVHTVNGVTGLMGPVYNGFRVNVNLVIDANSAKLEDYVQLNLTLLPTQIPGFQLIETSDFKTTKGQMGKRITYLASFNNKNQRNRAYFFDAGNGKKHCFTCSAPASHGEQLEPVFDDIIKSYDP